MVTQRRFLLYAAALVMAGVMGAAFAQERNLPVDPDCRRYGDRACPEANGGWDNLYSDSGQDAQPYPYYYQPNPSYYASPPQYHGYPYWDSYPDYYYGNFPGVDIDVGVNWPTRDMPRDPPRNLPVDPGYHRYYNQKYSDQEIRQYGLMP